MTMDGSTEVLEEVAPETEKLESLDHEIDLPDDLEIDEGLTPFRMGEQAPTLGPVDAVDDQTRALAEHVEALRRDPLGQTRRDLEEGGDDPSNRGCHADVSCQGIESGRTTDESPDPGGIGRGESPPSWTQ